MESACKLNGGSINPQLLAELKREGWFVDSVKLSDVLNDEAEEEEEDDNHVHLSSDDSPAKPVIKQKRQRKLPMTVQSLRSRLSDLDMREYGVGILNEQLDKKLGVLSSSGQTTGIVLQLAKWRNISRPKVPEHSDNDGLCKMSLTDGVVTVEALQLEPIPGLSGRTPYGTKLMLLLPGGGAGKIDYEGGMLILGPRNCKVLGGNVEKLVEKWQYLKIGGGPAKPTETATRAPKFKPFSASSSTSVVAASRGKAEKSQQQEQQVEGNKNFSTSTSSHHAHQQHAPAPPPPSLRERRQGAGKHSPPKSNHRNSHYHNQQHGGDLPQELLMAPGGVGGGGGSVGRREPPPQRARQGLHRGAGGVEGNAVGAAGGPRHSHSGRAPSPPLHHSPPRSGGGNRERHSGRGGGGQERGFRGGGGAGRGGARGGAQQSRNTTAGGGPPPRRRGDFGNSNNHVRSGGGSNFHPNPSHHGYHFNTNEFPQL